jgi:prepilin peptidase CpaA
MTHNSFELVHRLTLLAMLMAAMWHDTRYRRIPNTLVLWGSLTAIGLSVSTLGMGLNSALAGGVVGFLVFGVLYRFGMVGAGDVKLVAATGFFLGYPDILAVVLLIFLTGGVLSIGWAWFTNQLGRTFKNLHTAVSLTWQTTHTSSSPRIDMPMGPTRLPYALAIGTGTAIHVLSTWFAWPA